MKICVIVPCYNEGDVLRQLYQSLSSILTIIGYEYELLFVNDGSDDNTLIQLKTLSEADHHITYLSLSRNFGKEAAMYAGFCNADADYVAVMDADLQDPPELLPEMIRILENEEYDCVAARRVTRKGEPFIRSILAKGFYKLINTISDTSIIEGARDFRLMKRQMVDAIVAMREINRFSKGIFAWIGFRTYWIEYDNIQRAAGKTKWNLWSLTKYAFSGIIDFSEIPLSFASWIGFLMTIISFAFLILIVVRRLIFGDPVAGWASTICVIIFIGGIQLFCLGMIGQYIARNYTESKRRPHFIISETNKSMAVKIK